MAALSLLGLRASAQQMQPHSPQPVEDPAAALARVYHPADAPQRTSLDLIVDYLGAPPAPGSEIQPGLFAKREDGLQSPSFQFVIVTAPGPEYGYELHMQAVLDGAASLGYQLHSAWLPGELDMPGREGVFSPQRAAASGASPPPGAPAASRTGGLGVMLLRPRENAARAGASQATNQRLDGPGATPHHLLLYVVPERPSSGISLPAFKQALAEIWAISSAQSPCLGPVRPTIAVLGPTFSASRTSLVRALSDPTYGGHFRFEIRSGRASSTSNGTIFEDLLKEAGVQGSFNSAMHSAEQQLQRMLDFLCQHDKELYVKESGQNDKSSQDGNRGIPRIALLVESSTSWGQELLQWAKEARCRPSPEESQGDAARDGGIPAKEESFPRVRLLPLPYSVHISDLAHFARSDGAGKSPDGAARETADQAAAGRAASGLGSGPGHGAGPRDLPDPRSLGALRSKEQALANLLRTVAQEQIWYVGVVSLTAEDKYFLLRQVHDLMPGAQLFALDADHRDTDPEYLPFTQGMLTASTYPILSKTTLWQWPQPGSERRIQFSRGRDIGVYNAFLLLMSALNPGEPGIKKQLIGYGPSTIGSDPAQPNKKPPNEPHNEQKKAWLPSVWISRVTGEGVVPVYEYRDEGKPPGSADAKDAMRPIEHESSPADSQAYVGVRRTGTFDVLMLLSIFYFSLNIAIYILHRFFHNSISQYYVLNLFGVFSLPRRRGKPLREFGHRDKDTSGTLPDKVHKLQTGVESRLFRSVYFATIAVFVAVLQWHSLPLTCRTSQGDGLYVWLFEYGTEVLSFLLVGFMSAAALDVLFRGWQSNCTVSGELAKEEQERAKGELLQFVLGGLLVSVGYAVFLWICRRDALTKDIQSLLYLERATNLSYGLSILVPALCILALLLAWTAANCHRLRMLVSLHEDFGRLDDKGDPEHLRHIADILEHGWPMATNQAALMWIMPFISICPIYLYVFAELTVYEPGSCFLSVGFSFCYFAIIREFLLFAQLAYHFDQALLRIGVEPMLDAYRRLPVHFARHLGIQILESLDVHIEYQAIRVNLTLLKMHFRRMVEALRRSYPGILQLSATAQQEKDSQNPHIDEERLKRRFGDTAGALLARAAGALMQQPIQQPLHVLQREAVQFRDLPLIERLFIRLSSDSEEPPKSKKLSPFEADGVADVAEFVITVNRERPLPSSVQPLMTDGGEITKANLDSRPEIGTRTLLTQSPPDSLHLWLRQGEDLVAIQRVMFINRVFSALRSHLAFVVTGVVLLLLAFNLFPFQPLRLMMATIGGLLLVILPVTLWVFICLERDEVLSYIGHSTPGQLTWTAPFIGRLVAYIGVPLLTFLVAQIPGLQRLFASIISPLLPGLR